MTKHALLLFLASLLSTCFSTFSHFIIVSHQKKQFRSVILSGVIKVMNFLINDALKNNLQQMSWRTIDCYIIPKLHHDVIPKFEYMLVNKPQLVVDYNVRIDGVKWVDTIAFEYSLKNRNLQSILHIYTESSLCLMNEYKLVKCNYQGLLETFLKINEAIIRHTGHLSR
jgi:hypothetical protein